MGFSSSARLSQLEPWIEEWRLPTMHAAVSGSGAEDAWFVSSIQIEHSRIKNKSIIGGTLDIYKCFDQM
eukprot:1699741-Karenia_brevis.AAC.1